MNCSGGRDGGMLLQGSLLRFASLSSSCAYPIKGAWDVRLLRHQTHVVSSRGLDGKAGVHPMQLLAAIEWQLR